MLESFIKKFHTLIFFIVLGRHRSSLLVTLTNPPRNRSAKQSFFSSQPQTELFRNFLFSLHSKFRFHLIKIRISPPPKFRRAPIFLFFYLRTEGYTPHIFKILTKLFYETSD